MVECVSRWDWVTTRWDWDERAQGKRLTKYVKLSDWRQGWTHHIDDDNFDLIFTFLRFFHRLSLSDFFQAKSKLFLKNFKYKSNEWRIRKKNYQYREKKNIQGQINLFFKSTKIDMNFFANCKISTKKYTIRHENYSCINSALWVNWLSFISTQFTS